MLKILLKKFWWVLLLIFIMGLPQSLLKLYPDFLWFESVGYSKVFFTNIAAKLLYSGLFSGILFIFLLLNLFVANLIIKRIDRGTDFVSFVISKLFPGMDGYQSTPVMEVFQKTVKKYFWFVLITVIAGFSVIIGTGISLSLWDKILLYQNQVAGTVVDPIFGRNISFYFFSLPLYQTLVGTVLAIIIATIGLMGFFYFQAGLVRLSLDIFKEKLVKTHLLILGAAVFFLIGAKFWLGSFDILFAKGGRLFFGAGYTDIHARLLNFNVLAGLAVITGIILLVNIFINSLKPVWGFIGLMIFASIFLGGVYPSLIQDFVVKPNEYEKEKKYIEYNIDYTQKAYNLANVEEKFFPAEDKLGLKEINANKEIVNNIRLWDEAPLLRTFAQLQEIRTYYEFNSVDVDRYEIDGRMQQVMVSARELISDQLSDKAQNWVNRKLQYTHGYGIVMSPVNQITSEGMPDFYIKNIPPASILKDKVERPEIYFGEKTDEYVICNTTSQEFDYPQGDDNKYTQYTGKGGVVIDSLWKKIVFALRFMDSNILFTNYIKNDSRILYYRNIMERLQQIAPFIMYDNDPYVVLADGRLYWIVDGYTLSDKYPYSQPQGRFNYIRNSVKVVIDAYDGTVSYYLMDNTDPIAMSYSNIYKTLFKPFAMMPDKLKSHVRYPKDLFAIQAYAYRNYHMTNPQVFYNQEDLWEIPKERYEENDVVMDPYYVTMKLPGKTEFEFLPLMVPYAPAGKNNLIGWMVVNNNPDKYGQMQVYKLSKDKQVFGPMQLESRIDQDTTISQQFTLWGQKGSRVIRGNLLIIPIEGSLLYVEPIYLQATSSKLPQLKRIVVAYGDKVVMEDTLEKGISDIFGGNYRSDIVKTDVPDTKTDTKIKNLAREALNIYNKAADKLKQTDWAAYGEMMEKLKGTLQDMSR